MEASRALRKKVCSASWIFADREVRRVVARPAKRCGQVHGAQLFSQQAPSKLCRRATTHLSVHSLPETDGVLCPPGTLPFWELFFCAILRQLCYKIQTSESKAMSLCRRARHSRKSSILR